MQSRENPPLLDATGLRIMRLINTMATLSLDTPVRHLLGYTAEQMADAIQIHAEQETATIEKLLKTFPHVERGASKFLRMVCKDRVTLDLERVTYRFKNSTGKSAAYTFVSIFVPRETRDQCGGPDPVGEKLRELGVQAISAEIAEQARTAVEPKN